MRHAFTQQNPTHFIEWAGQFLSFWGWGGGTSPSISAHARSKNTQCVPFQNRAKVSVAARVKTAVKHATPSYPIVPLVEQRSLGGRRANLNIRGQF